MVFLRVGAALAECSRGDREKSTLLRKLNKEDYDGASAEFNRWNKGSGVVLAGLVTRRAAETKLFKG